MITLRGYQDDIVRGVRNEFAQGKKKVVAVAPTGAGKTIIFSHIARQTASRGKKVMVLAHRIELLEQCGEKLTFNSVEFGYLNPKYTPNPMAGTQVGTMQTVARRLAKLDFYPDLIIVDECHRIMGKTYRNILNFYQDAYLLGVTATPVRGDGQPLGDVFDAMVIGPSVQDLIAQGALVAPKTFAPLEKLSLKNVRINSNGDYDQNQLQAVLDQPNVTGNAVEHYKKICPGVPAVAFCVSVKHAEHVAAEFRAAGFTAEHIDGTMDDAQRKAILGRLRTGETNIVTSVDLITEGFDAPMLQAAIMLRPTQSEGLYLQMAGRVLRPFPGKQVAYILDHAGCTLMHGLVTEPREWGLEMGEEKKKRKKRDAQQTVRVAQCPTCFIMHEPAPACPSCGHVYKIEGAMPDQVEGELKEVDAVTAKMLRLQKTREVAQAQTLEELEAIEKARHYKPGWAKWVWTSRMKKLNLV